MLIYHRLAVAIAMAGILTFGFTVVAATDEPPECAGLSAQVRANFKEVRDGKLVPICPVAPQAAREAADPCKQLGAEAQRLWTDWMHGDAYLRAARNGRAVTVREMWGRDVGSAAEARALVANADTAYPATLDRLLALRCKDDMPVGVVQGWSDEVLLAMVKKGTLTWDRWATWEWKNLVKP